MNAGPDFGIRGERVALVPIDRERHLECFLRWLNDPEVTRYTLRHGPLARLLRRGAWHDMLLFDMLEQDWFAGPHASAASG